mmetsp:Transcript_9665/g.14711  ORF Transcript_9665/g.14711 Transcript_9665/m.14711 type:complete len:260 (+) Transcript_9665:283-1062(+)
MKGSGFIGPVPALVLIAIQSFRAVRTKVRTGSFIDKTNSNFLKENGDWKMENLVPLIGNWYGNTAQVFLFAYAFKFAKLGGLNQGVIPIITLFSALFNAVIFYFAFGERLNCPKAFGMLMAVSCIFCLALDSMEKEAAGGEHSQMIYSFYALGLAFLVPIGFSYKHYVTRRYSDTYNYYDLGLDSGILENLTFSVFSIYLLRTEGFSLSQLFYGGASGLLLALGKVFIAVAVVEGMAGPAQAVMATNSVYMTILTVVVD